MRVYMECTLNYFMHFSVHPEQPPVHADQFDVPNDPLELLYLPVPVHVVHGDHGVHMDCTLINLMHFLVHHEQPPVLAYQFDGPHDPLELFYVPVLVQYMWYIGVMVYMDCTLINVIHFSVRPEQLPGHADQFDVPHVLLECLHVTVLAYGVHEGHGVHGQHPEQLYALISASRTTSCSC
jgi:hypothetical protein